MKKNQLICLILGLCFVTYSYAEKTKMKVVAQFDAGQPNASIFKMYDASDDVICYVLMPEVTTRKKTENGWTYEGNSVGSISCLKNRQMVIPIQPPAQQPGQVK